MNIQHLRHFVAVAEELHFGRAAERIGMAQAPLSQSIHRLETSLGARLFERTRRHVALTQAGEALLDHARDIIAQVDYSRKAVQRATQGMSELTVGYLPGALGLHVPMAMRIANELAPDTRITLLESVPDQQLSPLLAGDTDIGFFSGYREPTPQLKGQLIDEIPLVAAIPEDWPLARKSEVSIADFDGLPILVFPAHRDPAWHATIIRSFQSAGVKPNIVQEAISDTTRMKLVSAGIGATWVLATSAPAGYPGVALRRIVDLPDSLKLPMHLYWHRSAPATVQKICEMILKEMSEQKLTSSFGPQYDIPRRRTAA